MKSAFASFLLFVAVLAFSLAVQFREQILNHFSILYGNRYDAVIAVAILEHWFNVFSGASKWSQLFYFFPYQRTLGQTDGYFLVGIIYSGFRVFGMDPFLSGELANMSLRAIGFGGIFAVCRRVLGISFSWSLLAGALFTLCNNATSHGSRLQFNTIAFAPILMLLLWYMYHSMLNRNSRNTLAFGILAAVLFGAWCISCFYMAWFFVLLAVTVVTVMAAGAGSDRLIAFKDIVVGQRIPLILVLGSALVSLIPLLWVYIPKSREVGMRPYALVASNTVPIEGILQVGTDNFMFGRLYNGFLALVSPAYVPNGEYYNTGIAPVMFVLFVAGCFYIFKNRNIKNFFFLRSIAIATAFSWCLILNVFGHSLWYFVYSFFPGAKALNVVASYQIFLAFPVILICVFYLSSIADTLPRMIIALLAAILVLEEANKTEVHLVRADEIRRVSVSKPPVECAAFFVTGWPNQVAVTPMAGWVNDYYAHNVSAMMIAELVRLPTINGIASFMPPGWNFGEPNNSNYLERVRLFAEGHGVNGLCKLNLSNQTWDTVW